MQPLSHVSPGALTTWGDQHHMGTRPNVAIKIAECIAEWAEIETFLGQLLGLILHTSPNAALIMFSSLENRSAQLRMVTAAAESELDQEKKDLFAIMMMLFLRPSMKERDRLAHWCWGSTDALPEALLLASPAKKMVLQFQYNQGKFSKETSPLPDRDIYVVTTTDLTRMADRFRIAKDHLLLFMGAIWNKNEPPVRDACIQKLKEEPQILERLSQLIADRQKNQKPQPKDPALTPRG